MASNKESLDAFVTRLAAEDSTSCNNAGHDIPARRTLVLHSSGSGNSMLTGESSSSTTTSNSRVLSDILLDSSDDEDGIQRCTTL